MIGRTAYGNVSGTRTATDLAEFPSIFMESFVNSPTLLPLLVAHHSTGQPPTPELIAAHLKASSSFPSIEIASQVQMALVDQKLHAISPSDPLDSSQIYHDVTESMGLYPSTPGTSPQTQFGHLNGYGASYYAYLFDRAIAGRVWSEVFKGGKGGGGLEGLREGGERLSEEVLKWGGAKDPWEMVGGLLKDDVIRGGGGAAMEKVGEWGIKGWGSDGKS
jgi:intermediate peptidase